MNKTNVDIAEAYYKAMGEKKFNDMEKHLHPEVQLKNPLGELKGKEAVFEAAKKFAVHFKTLKIRTRMDSGDQVMLVYDLDYPAPIGSVPAAGLLNFKDGLITRIELFLDVRPLL